MYSTAPVFQPPQKYPPVEWSRIREKSVQQNLCRSSKHELWQEMSARYQKSVLERKRMFNDNRLFNTITPTNEAKLSEDFEIWEDEDFAYGEESDAGKGIGPLDAAKLDMNMGIHWGKTEEVKRRKLPTVRESVQERDPGQRRRCRSPGSLARARAAFGGFNKKSALGNQIGNALMLEDHKTRALHLPPAREFEACDVTMVDETLGAEVESVQGDDECPNKTQQKIPDTPFDRANFESMGFPARSSEQLLQPKLTVLKADTNFGEFLSLRRAECVATGLLKRDYSARPSRGVKEETCWRRYQLEKRIKQCKLENRRPVQEIIAEEINLKPESHCWSRWTPASDISGDMDIVASRYYELASIPNLARFTPEIRSELHMAKAEHWCCFTRYAYDRIAPLENFTMRKIEKTFKHDLTLKAIHYATVLDRLILLAREAERSPKRYLWKTSMRYSEVSKVYHDVMRNVRDFEEAEANLFDDLLMSRDQPPMSAAATFVPWADKMFFDPDVHTFANEVFDEVHAALGDELDEAWSDCEE